MATSEPSPIGTDEFPLSPTAVPIHALIEVGYLHPLSDTVHDHPEDEWAEWHPAVRKAMQERHAKCSLIYKVAG